MARNVFVIPIIPDNVDDTDEVTVLYEELTPIKKGTSMLDAIPVETDHLWMDTLLEVDGLYYDDDEVQLLESFPKPLTQVYKGESSNSKSAEDTKPIIISTFMCEICADEKPKSDLFRILGCNHSYCSECIGNYVASKLQENVTAVNCPAIGCDGFLEPHHCQSILPKEVFDRWGDALCEALILASEKFYCPFKDCSALLIHEKGGNDEVVIESECPECNRLFCAQCRVPWHSGITCEEFKKLNEDEKSSDDILLKNLAKSNKWMRCSMCKFYIERNQGCLFMKCRCGYTFCYNCGAPLKDHYCQICKR